MKFLQNFKQVLPFRLKHLIKRWLLKLFWGASTELIKKQKNKKPNHLNGINVIGFSGCVTGLGESARSFSSSAIASGVKTTDIPVSFSPTLAFPEIPPLAEFNLYDINIFHINAALVEQIAPLMTELFRGRYNIGYWHWELSDFPEKWKPAFDYFDEIWVPSEFVRLAVAKKSNIPVVRIPHAIKLIPFEKKDRSYFKLPPEDFLVLTLCDVGSVVERKNPFAAIEAYEKAFSEKGNATLVVKIINGETNRRALKDLRNKLKTIKSVLIEETISKKDVWALINCCDTYISLHRSEGFGLVIAEAMLLKKPVVVTNYSGNTDFCNVQNAYPANFKLVKIKKDCSVYEAGNVWAEADTTHAAQQLLKIAQNYEDALKIAAAAEKTIKSEYCPEVIGQIYRNQFKI